MKHLRFLDCRVSCLHVPSKRVFPVLSFFLQQTTRLSLFFSFLERIGGAQGPLCVLHERNKKTKPKSYWHSRHGGPTAFLIGHMDTNNCWPKKTGLRLTKHRFPNVEMPVFLPNSHVRVSSTTAEYGPR